ncbi:MAG TPA: DUF3299 domain-containing protein [Planctomycetota bacterium]|nr:DUF3299 domain-containing protein [Planctomycetota bacterium]
MTDRQKQSQRGDFKLALGAIACIAIGGAVSYWIAHSTRRERPAPIVVNDGEPLISSGSAQTRVQPAAPSQPMVTEAGDFAPLSFTTLASFYYELPEPNANSTRPDPFPAPIKAFNGKRVAIQGFMLPTDLKNGRTTRFLLCRDQSICCKWGPQPRMNEWISVIMTPGKAAHVVMDQPVTVFGSIEIGEQIENGEVMSVYRLDADDVAGPLDL